MKVSRSYIVLLAVVSPTDKFTAGIAQLIRIIQDGNLLVVDVPRADTHVWNQQLPELLAGKGIRVDRPVSVIRGDYLDLTDYGKKLLSEAMAKKSVIP